MSLKSGIRGLLLWSRPRWPGWEGMSMAKDTIRKPKTASRKTKQRRLGMRRLVPPAGFEPAISTLKGWRPGPLDDGGPIGIVGQGGGKWEMGNGVRGRRKEEGAGTTAGPLRLPAAGRRDPG